MLHLAKEIKAICQVTPSPSLGKRSRGAVVWSLLQSRVEEERKGECPSGGSLAQRSQGTNFVLKMTQMSIL